MSYGSQCLMDVLLTVLRYCVPVCVISTCKPPGGASRGLLPCPRPSRKHDLVRGGACRNRRYEAQVWCTERFACTILLTFCWYRCLTNAPFGWPPHRGRGWLRILIDCSIVPCCTGPGFDIILHIAFFPLQWRQMIRTPLLSTRLKLGNMMNLLSSTFLKPTLTMKTLTFSITQPVMKLMSVAVLDVGSIDAALAALYRTAHHKLYMSHMEGEKNYLRLSVLHDAENLSHRAIVQCLLRWELQEFGA